MGNQTSNEGLFSLINSNNDSAALAYLQSGANVNSISHSGLSVLRASLENGLSGLFKYCYLHDGVMIPCLEHDQTPLHRSVQLGYHSLTYNFIRDSSLFKKYINSQDELGNTPLHIAVEIGSPDIVALLLKYNASRYIRNLACKTPHDLAVESQSDFMNEILEQLSMEDCMKKKNSGDVSPIREQGSTQESKSMKKLTNDSKKNRNQLQKALEDYKIPVIRNSEIRVMELINKGSSCLVFKGKWRGTEVAIKQFTEEYSTSDKEMGKFIKELKVLCQIRHPNLLLLMGICIDQANLCIVTELMPNFTLFYAIHTNKQHSLTLSEKFQISTQIARGLLYLHSNEPPIVHRDLKPENCLLDQSLNVKIADFGLARPVSDFAQESTTICIGTTRFMAPELFEKSRSESIGVEIDIWALGCILIEIFSGCRPWHHISGKAVNNIYYELYNKRPVPIPTNIPPEIAEIIRECCRYNRKKRPKVVWVLERLESAKSIYIIN